MPDKTAIAVGLDAGSAQTRCLILAMEEGRLAYLGHGEVESTGWSKSRLVDQKALTACVQSAVRRAEMEARVPVDAMVVGIGGSSIDGHNSRGLYEFGRPRAVTLDDMAYAVERSEQVRLEEDRAILHSFPQDFTLDGRCRKALPARVDVLAAGGERSHRHRFPTGARFDCGCCSASLLCDRRDHV